MNAAYLSHLSVKYMKLETVVLGRASRKPSRVVIKCFTMRRRSKCELVAVYRQVTTLYRQWWENEIYWIVARRSHHRPQHDYESRAAQLAVYKATSHAAQRQAKFHTSSQVFWLNQTHVKQFPSYTTKIC
jgi:hypothetical protein